MKTKPLIDEQDLILNPSGYFGKKIPFFYPLEGKYSVERGHMNYGVFRSIEYVNKKASPIIDAIVSYCCSTNDDEKSEALIRLNEIAKEYKKDE